MALTLMVPREGGGRRPNALENGIQRKGRFRNDLKANLGRKGRMNRGLQRRQERTL